MNTGREVCLVEEEDDGWSAIDKETGVASCGDTCEEALEMLDEAGGLHTGEADEPVADEDPAELGLDPDEVPGEVGELDAPWFDDADETA